MRKIFCAVVVVCLVRAAWGDVFVNEIDYDQPGVDTAEFIELAGTAGVNLSGWMLELVNGADNSTYLSILLPNYTFSDQTGSGWGFFVLGRPSVPNMNYDFGADASVQNGSPDGVRLLNPSLAVVHYVSYEGAMPGATDIVPIGVQDDNVLSGSSIYKTGSGSSPGDFSWAYGANSDTPGTLNPGQTLTAVPEPVGMMWAGIAAMGLLRRRRNRRAGAGTRGVFEIAA